MQKEEALQQRLADLQLCNKQRAKDKDQRKKPRKAQYQASSSGEDVKAITKPVVAAQQIPTSRSGRQLHKPQYLDNCQL